MMEVDRKRGRGKNFSVVGPVSSDDGLRKDRKYRQQEDLRLTKGKC